MSIINECFFVVDSKAVPASPPDPLPIFLYQLFTSQPPMPFPDILPMSDRDARDGFVHLARALNILPLAMKNYNYTIQLWILKLNYQWMRENRYDVRWEWSSSGTTIYPHLYHNTTKKMVIDMKTWTREANYLWNQTLLVDDPWLTDGNINSATSWNPTAIAFVVLQLQFTTLSFYFIAF